MSFLWNPGSPACSELVETLRHLRSLRAAPAKAGGTRPFETRLCRLFGALPENARHLRWLPWLPLQRLGARSLGIPAVAVYSEHAVLSDSDAALLPYIDPAAAAAAEIRTHDRHARAYDRPADHLRRRTESDRAAYTHYTVGRPGCIPICPRDRRLNNRLTGPPA